MKVSFEKQKALVTGGTRGIGRQVAKDLANLGANVTVTFMR
jgi:NAD(P)-dependent dehydrogenase (short-subunit alcohol dehydrogenase family)